MEALYLEFVNRVNEVGIDVNKCVAYPHTAPLVQFVCGLGPRKGYHLLRVSALLILCMVLVYCWLCWCNLGLLVETTRSVKLINMATVVGYSVVFVTAFMDQTCLQ